MIDERVDLMDVPTVSVVFRAFNCRKYIGLAIESVLSQTFQDFEIIIVDDASTDATPDILRDYSRQDQRIRVIRNESNQGPVRTMNIGVRHARGEFVAVHDSDDLSLSHRLETQLNFLKANPGIALIGGGAYFIDEEGELLRVGTAKQRTGEAVRRFLTEGRTFIHSSVMYRRICIETIDFYDEFFLYAHDYDMLVRMAEAFDLCYYEEPLVKWRKLNSGITGRKKLAQAAFAELASLRHKAKMEGVSIDLQQEYDRLINSGQNASGDNLKQSSSEARYYYHIGLQLLEQGNRQTARRRFLQALRNRESTNITLRTLFFFVLSFWPAGISSKPVQVLRKTL